MPYDEGDSALLGGVGLSAPQSVKQRHFAYDGELLVIPPGLATTTDRPLEHGRQVDHGANDNAKSIGCAKRLRFIQHCRNAVSEITIYIDALGIA